MLAAIFTPMNFSLVTCMYNEEKETKKESLKLIQKIHSKY